MGGVEGCNFISVEKQQFCLQLTGHQIFLQHGLNCPEILTQWVRGETQESADVVSILRNSDTSGPRPILKKME